MPEDPIALYRYFARKKTAPTSGRAEMGVVLGWGKNPEGRLLEPPLDC